MMTQLSAKLGLDQPAMYRISIQGILAESWSDYLGGLDIRRTVTSLNHDVTILTGQLRDQAALLGMLNSLYGLGLPLLSVERIAPNNDT
jgi:hypothetical protein